MIDRPNGIGQPIDRRSLLALMAATGAGTLPLGAAAQGTPAFELEDAKYRPAYDGLKGYYFQDPEWVKQTVPRLT